MSIIKPHDGYYSTLDETEIKALGKILYEKHPDCMVSWDRIHESVQSKWIEFARFSYNTIITAISAPPRDS